MYKKYNKHSDVIDKNVTSKKKPKDSKRDEHFLMEEQKTPKGILIDNSDYNKHHHIYHHHTRERNASLNPREKSKIASKDCTTDKKSSRKRHHSAYSTDNPHKSAIKKHEPVQKSNTFIVDTKRPTKIVERVEKHQTSRHRSGSAKKSKDLNKDKVSQIWYCQVETNSPFKRNKKDFEPEQPKKHKSLKETATSTRRRNKSSEKQVLNVLPDVQKSRIHHFKDPTLSTVIKSKADKTSERTSHQSPKPLKKSEKSSKERAKINKKIQHKPGGSRTQINVDQKIEDGLKMYFTKLQNIIDKKFEAILPNKEEPVEVKKERRKHTHKIDKHHEVKEKEEILKKKYRSSPHNRAEKDKNHFMGNGAGVHKENVENYNRSLPKSHDKHRRYHSHPENIKSRPKTDYPDHDNSAESHANLLDKQTNLYYAQQTNFYSTKQEKLDKQTSSVKKRNQSCSTKQASHEDDYTIIKDVLNGHVATNPSTSVMYVKPPLHKTNSVDLYYYDRNSTKHIDLYNREESKERKYQRKDKENHFWVEGVEPAKRDTIPKAKKKKVTPNLQSKIVSIIGIPSQTKDQSYKYYSENIEEVLERKNKLKRFKLYYHYLRESSLSGSDTGRNPVPSESCKIVTDQSESNEFYPLMIEKPKSSNDDRNIQLERNTRKLDDNTVINIKLDDYQFYLKENMKDKPICLTNTKDQQKPKKEKRQQPTQRKIRAQVMNEVVLNAKSDSEVSYSTLTVKSLNIRHHHKARKPEPPRPPLPVPNKNNLALEDITIKEFYNNIDYFKGSFEKQTPENCITNLQVLQFLDNMHQLYLASQQTQTQVVQPEKNVEAEKYVEVEKKSEVKEISTNTSECLSPKKPSKDNCNLLVNRSVEACNYLEEPKIVKPINTKMDRMTSYQEFFRNKSDTNDSEEININRQNEVGLTTLEQDGRILEDVPLDDPFSTKSVAIQETSLQLNTRNTLLTDTELSKSRILQTKNHERKKCTSTAVVGDTKTSEIGVEVGTDCIEKRALKSINKSCITTTFKSCIPRLPSTPPTKDISEMTEQKRPSTAILKTMSKKSHKIEDALLPTIAEAKTVKYQKNDELSKHSKDDGKPKQSKGDGVVKKKIRRPHSASSTTAKICEESRDIDNFKIKKSRSEINFDKLEKEESKINSLVCFEGCQNESQVTDVSHAKAHSLDRYLLSNKSLANDYAHNSTLLVTKDYRTADVSSYHKRKKYDEVIRKKMKKRMIQEKQLSHIFEVRYLTLDGNNKNVLSETLERIPESEECLNKMAKEKFIKLTNKRYDKFLNSIKNNTDSPYNDLYEFLSQVPEVSCQDAHKHNFNLKNKCKHCDTGKNFMNFVNYLCSSLKSKCSSIKSTEEESVQSNRIETKKPVSKKKKFYNMRKVEDTTSSCNDDNEDDYQFPVNNTIEYSEHMSCPVLKESDSSFDFLYREESNSTEEAISNAKKPVNSILGFSLNSEITLKKNNQQSIDSPCSETSGYASSRSKHSFSFLNFFKKPKMAALLKPQIEEGMFGRHITAYNKMTQEEKVKEDESYEEIPLDVLLKNSDSEFSSFGNSITNLNLGYCQSVPCYTFQEDIESKKFASDTNLLFSEIKVESLDFNKKSSDLTGFTQQDVGSKSSTLVDSILQKDSDSEQIALLEKIIDSDLYLTNLSSCSITLVESIESLKSSKNKLFKDRTCSRPEIKRLIAKKFFENILDMYENESAISSALFEDPEFMEKDLMTSVKNWKKAKTDRRPFGSRFKDAVKKIFHHKHNYAVMEVVASHDIQKSQPIENEYQKKLQALAHSARKYFSSLVQAVAVNNKMDDEMKMYGILRLLEAIEKGQFTFLKKFASSQQKVELEREIRQQVMQMFVDVYSNAKTEAAKSRRKLSSNDMKLMGAFVCKYRIGLLSRTDIVASYLGKGFFQNENQLKAAVTFLLKTTNEVNLQDFEEYCQNI